MDQIPGKVKRIIDRYIKALEKQGIRLRQVIVFGSYASGRYDEWSDIDIALVSEAFEGVRMNDRNKIRRITLNISSDLEPLPYRPEDFTADDPFVREILETGIRIV
jgi:predicted nucleotidyltransferase